MLFTSVLQFYQFIQEAQGLQADAPVLYWKLRIEKIRLISWGGYWGLDGDKFDTWLAAAGLRDDVCGILRQLEELLSDSDRLSKKYGLLKPPNHGSTTGISTGSLQLAERDPKIKSSVKSKFRWAFTDKAKFKTLLTDLRDLNDGLHSLLRLAEFSVVNSATQSRAL
jgi:hypothetical protein